MKRIPADELLEQLRQKSVYDQETGLHDYIIEHNNDLEPDELVKLLKKFIEVEDLLAEERRFDSDDDGYELTLNDSVFCRLWLAKLYAPHPDKEEACVALVEKAKELLHGYDDDSYPDAAEQRAQHKASISTIEEQLAHRHAVEQEGEQPTELMPKALKQHLSLLEKKVLFHRSVSENVGHEHRHCYLLTGNRGTGKRTAAKRLFDLLKILEPNLERFEEMSAISLFDPSNGFAAINEQLEQYRNAFVYIYDADELSLKGLLAQTGIEILANKLKTEPKVTVVLSGPQSELQQLVNSCQAAKELFVHQFHFDDLKPETLTDKAIAYAEKNGYAFTADARQELANYFGYEHKMRGSDFGNIHLAHQTVDDHILPHLIARVVDSGITATDKAQLITAEDIPQIRHRDPEKAIERLDSLVGLDNIKESIMAHASLVNLNRRRMELGMFNHMPPMHMVFTGNPGTGKTTVAQLIGEIYHGMGVLSSGHLVETDRSKLVGQYLGDTEKNTLNAIKSAAGGVLFIDEAYNLFVEDSDRRDFGHRVIETLLTYLSMEQTNMIVVLAGYTAEMEHLLQSNPGLKSRFSYIFHFNDYTPEQLLRIGGFVLKKEQYQLTPEAEKKLAQYVINAYNNKDEHFGNGRFITRLLTTRVIPSVGNRLIKMAPEDIANEALSTITEADIPEIEDQRTLLSWDEAIVGNALEQLEQLAGLQNVKKALNEYVVSLRANYLKKAPMTGNDLTWSFLGNTGTGKSTVAQILAQILQGAGLIPTGHFTTLNIEEFATLKNQTPVIEKAMMRASDGLLFLDLDSPQYKNYNMDFLQFWIENKRKELKMTIAIVIAKTDSDNDGVARNLVHNGVVPSNHILVFEDYKPDELMGIFKYLLKHHHALGISAEAEAKVQEYIKKMYDSRKQLMTNARTMQMLAGTVAQTAQLRIFKEGEAEQDVTLADVDKLDWDGSLLYRRIGF